VKKFALGFVAAIVALPIACMAYFAVGFSPIQADARPSVLETAIFSPAVRASVNRSASGILNPQPADDEAIIAGGKLYVLGCQGCHGNLGGVYQEDRNHFPPAPELPHIGTRYSEPQLYWIVKHGVRMTGMSAYGPFYSEKELWSLAAFLHRINELPPETVEEILGKKAGPS
jgi:mono/diheme cytochrome c family protein